LPAHTGRRSHHGSSPAQRSLTIDRMFDIAFLAPGVEAYVFTFG
jgi:hypothetical protein